MANANNPNASQNIGLFTPRPRALPLKESHALVTIFIQDIICGKKADLSKLQHVKDFDITLDMQNVLDVLSKLLYYRFYRHNHFVHELNIASLLKLLHDNYKFGITHEMDKLLNICFARAINNYIHIHVSYFIDKEKVLSDNDNLDIPERSEKTIISYCEKLIIQYREVFGAMPSITLIEQYRNFKQLEINDRQMYNAIAEHGFIEKAQELFNKSWPIFIQVYPADNTEKRYEMIKNDLGKLTAEQCNKFINGINPDKYDKLIDIVSAVVSKFNDGK